MAIAFLRAVYHSRKCGHSAVRGAAYRTGTRLVDARTGEVCDWTHRKDDVLFEKLFTPDHAPADLRNDRAALWNAVEAAEVRGDARLAYEIKVAIPHELDLAQAKELTSAYADLLMQRHGQAVDLTIHKPDAHGDTRNIHAHLMLSPRALDAEGFAKKKLREITDKVQGPKEIEGWRQGWTDLANNALERAGHDTRIDLRSYKRQGIEREGEIHLGPAASAMERKGIQTDKGDINREIQQRNEDRDQAQVIDLQIEREKRAQEHQRREEMAGRYAQTMAREQREMDERHARAKDEMTAKVEARQERMEQRLQGRFRGGLFGWWDKLTGTHERIERENEREREEQRRQAEAERLEMEERQRHQQQRQAAYHARLERDRLEILAYGEVQRFQQDFNRQAGQERAQEKPRDPGQPAWMDDGRMAEGWKKQMEQAAQEVSERQQREQGRGRERSLGYER